MKADVSADEGFFESLKVSVSKLSKAGSGASALVLPLVHALSAPPSPDAFAGVELPFIKVDNRFNYQKDPKWLFGEYRTRQALVKFLIKEAKRTWDNNKEGAHQLARAATILAAQEGFDDGPGLLNIIINDPDFEMLSGWSARQVTGLREVVADNLKQTAKAIAPFADACKALDSLIGSSDADAPSSEVAAVLKSLTEGLSLAGNRPGDQWRVLNLAWKLKNLTHSKWNGACEPMVSKQVNEWEAQCKRDPIELKWCGEILSIQGDAPSSSGVHVITSVDDPMYKKLFGVK